MMENMWLGNNQLGIRFYNGQWVVREDYEDWAVVFSGSYNECVDYVQKRWVSYQEEIVG